MTETSGDPREGRREGPLLFVFYRGDWWPYCNGQLVSYARDYEEFEKRGFGVVGISGDPRGDLIQSLDLWNEEEGVSEPALSLEALGPYYLGTYFATVAMQKKLEGEAKEKVEGYQELVEEYNAAIQETTERGS